MDFDIKINVNDINYILNILAERPYKESVNIINSITKQATDQQQKDTEQ